MATELKVNDADVARIALDQVWRELAPHVDRAKELKTEVERHPSLADEPSNVVLLRWLNAFERELGAIQKVREASNLLPVDDVRLARSTAEKVLETLKQARRVVAGTSPNPPS